MTASDRIRDRIIEQGADAYIRIATTENRFDARAMEKNLSKKYFIRQSFNAMEILRMKVPADLVVLSACETARGKVFRSEGIVGLTRAFMIAGVPRVLCSLWKVDDEATKALMVKFYELWNPTSGDGLPAAEALRRAQEFVRGHKRWSHPRFWAAWVLWGLPE